MTKLDFTSTILVRQSRKEAIEAIKNVRGWWSEEIEGNTDKLNDEFTYHYEDVHRCKMKLIELIPNEKVVWLVMDNYFSFTKDKSEWVGTKIVFELSKKEFQTQIIFTHEGLVPKYECYDICQNAWSTYIQKSLYSLITTGRGQPNGKGKQQTDFTTIILVNQTPKKVFDAINNPQAWWSGEIKGSTNKLNDEFTYRYKELHFSKQRIVEIIPNQKVVWLVIESKINYAEDKMEWTNTKISFEISEINNKTQLRFTHLGLVPEIECFDSCSNSWSQLIQQSLFSLITTGKAKNIFLG